MNVEDKGLDIVTGVTYTNVRGSAYRDDGDGFMYFHPYYLSELVRAKISNHTAEPILEKRYTLHGCWATIRRLTRAETAEYLGVNYVRNCSPTMT